MVIFLALLVYFYGRLLLIADGLLMFYKCVFQLKVLVVMVLLSASFGAQSSSCSAQEDAFNERCFYVGAGFGLSQLNGFNDDNASWKIDNINSSGMELFAGYHFIPRWFAEFSYTQFGTMDLVNPYGSEQEYADISFSGLALKGGYYLPISWLSFGRIESSDFQPFVKMGLVNVSYSTSDSQVELDEGASIKPQFALGVDWRFSNHWQARAQWESTYELAHITQLAISYLFSIDNSAPKKPDYKKSNVDESEYRPLNTNLIKTTAHKNKSTYQVILFKAASTNIDSSSEAIIANITRLLTEHPHLQISIMDVNLIQNFSQERTSLTQQRAKRLRKILTDAGISATRINKNNAAESISNPYQSADFFGKEINVKTLVLSPIGNNKWTLFNR